MNCLVLFSKLKRIYFYIQIGDDDIHVDIIMKDFNLYRK